MSALSIQEIRVFTKDLPEYNFLSQGSEESSAELIELALEGAVNFFNQISPVTNYTVDNFPNKIILLNGVCWLLAMAEMNNQVRNQISYSAQGLTAGINDKAPLYQALATMYKENFLSGAQEFKRYINMADAWGSVSSPYIAINTADFRG